MHGCALVLGTTGLFIRGRSGSGKSGLAQNLIARWNEQGRYARWIGDDRVVIQTCNKRILAHTPDNIKGLVEYRFLGIGHSPYERCCMIDLVVDLVEPKLLERMPEPRSVKLTPPSSSLELIQVPEQSVSHAADLVCAHLRRMK